MRAFDPEVVNALWSAIEPLIPVRSDHHPLGCHRPRKSDRDCFEVMLVRLVTGCSWVDAERLTKGVVSDTTAVNGGTNGLPRGSLTPLPKKPSRATTRSSGSILPRSPSTAPSTRAPAGGQGTGKSYFDRGKLGWKWSIATDTQGIPLGWTIAGANRHDYLLLEATLDEVEGRGLLGDIETMWLDRGYGFDSVRTHLEGRGMDDLMIAPRARKYVKHRKKRAPAPRGGHRWAVERTNSWLSNYGQLRRNTDRKPHHRLAQLALAIALLITAKLIDWRNRWAPIPAPIR